MGRTETHGMSGTPTYISWSNMMGRCANSTYCKKKNITVCERWRSFENFYKDMGKRPKGMTLDRIDNNKGYYKENCRWATHIQQNNNRSNTKFITFEGKTMSLFGWLRFLGINHKLVVSRRMTAGWSF